MARARSPVVDIPTCTCGGEGRQENKNRAWTCNQCGERIFPQRIKGEKPRVTDLSVLEACYKIMAMADDYPTTSDLARHFGVTYTPLHYRLKSMEARGLIRRIGGKSLQIVPRAIIDNGKILIRNE